MIRSPSLRPPLLGPRLRALAVRHPRAYRLYRICRWLLVDAAIALAAGWLAIGLRFEKVLPVAVYESYLPWLWIPAVATPVTALVTGVYMISWRRPTRANIIHTALSVSIALGVAVVVFYGFIEPRGLQGSAGLPRSYWPLQASIALVLSLALRNRHGWLFLAPRPPVVERRRHLRTLLYGAGEAGSVVSEAAMRDEGAGINPVGFLDDDPTLWGQQVAGLHVYGSSAVMATVAAHTNARQLLITMPNAPGTAVRRVYDAAIGAGLSVRTMPSLGELISGSTDPMRIRSVKLSDLLRRPISKLDQSRVRKLIEGRSVLVTGAAGSIGSEILRQVIDAGPSALVAFDQAESALFEVERDILDRLERTDGARPTLTVELGSVADGPRLSELFARHSVDIVIHAAAYKHVPMLELHPAEAVVNNVGGTLELLREAKAAGVGRFVLVSTDKAVNPTSVMGATKRLAELAVVAFGQAPSAWDAVVVRFGNVLGSAGSVIPIFEAQLARGAPITITHPDATRYFMTIPEASQLVLSAAALGGPGTVYVLQMGEPVRIADLARDLIRLSGRDERVVEIQYTGLRPGERLHETLFSPTESDEPTEDSRIMRASSSVSDPDVIARLEDLVRRARDRSLAAQDVLDLASALDCDDDAVLAAAG